MRVQEAIQLGDKELVAFQHGLNPVGCWTHSVLREGVLGLRELMSQRTEFLRPHACAWDVHGCVYGSGVRGKGVGGSSVVTLVMRLVDRVRKNSSHLPVIWGASLSLIVNY